VIKVKKIQPGMKKVVNRVQRIVVLVIVETSFVIPMKTVIPAKKTVFVIETVRA
jgi:hypothetical protein